MKTRKDITAKTINRITTLVVENSSWDKPLPTPKPRNFVAKNAINSGAGAHKDKKRESKNGNEKHKNKKFVGESLSVILETLTPQDISSLEAFAKRLYKSAGVEVAFSNHFGDQVNLSRNIKEITTSEVQRLFKAVLHKYRNKFSDLAGKQLVIHDIASEINMPTVFSDISGIDKSDKKSKKRERVVKMIPKTIMRKKDYNTNDPFLYVDSSN